MDFRLRNSPFGSCFEWVVYCLFCASNNFRRYSSFQKGTTYEQNHKQTLFLCNNSIKAFDIILGGLYPWWKHKYTILTVQAYSFSWHFTVLTNGVRSLLEICKLQRVGSGLFIYNPHPSQWWKQRRQAREWEETEEHEERGIQAKQRRGQAPPHSQGEETRVVSS